MIDYQKVAYAVNYYRSAGYELIDVPWVIDREAYQSTFPEGAFPFFTLGGFLPASGEQSFVQLLLEGNLETGRYQCVTPCYRDEEYDELHLPYFFKVELIDVGTYNYLPLLCHAEQLFARWCKLRRETMSSDQSDLVEDSTGIELGSYGRREYSGYKWCYGTGLAEPRLSQVLALSTH